jgi:hypothetical protein
LRLALWRERAGQQSRSELSTADSGLFTDQIEMLLIAEEEMLGGFVSSGSRMLVFEIVEEMIDHFAIGVSAPLG